MARVLCVEQEKNKFFRFTCGSEHFLSFVHSIMFDTMNNKFNGSSFQFETDIAREFHAANERRGGEREIKNVKSVNFNITFASTSEIDTFDEN